MRISLVPPRSHQPEILDEAGHRYDEIAPALRDIGRVNRWLGGAAAIVRPVLGLASQWGLKEISVLDVGTGGADVPRALIAAGPGRGLAVRAVGVDLDPLCVRFAAEAACDSIERKRTLFGTRPRRHSSRQLLSVHSNSFDAVRSTMLPTRPEPILPAWTESSDTLVTSRSLHSASESAPNSERTAGPPFRSAAAFVRQPEQPSQGLGAPAPSPASGLALVRADGFALPFEAGTFDVVSCSLFLHHFSEEDASRLVAEFARVARRAVLVNDLARHLVPWATIHLLGKLFAESAMFQHDAPLSVLRGWTREELRAVAAKAGLAPRAKVLRRAPYRLVLVIETGP